MRRFIALWMLALVFVAPATAAAAGSAWVEGNLVHISTTNVKLIDDKTGQSLSFLLPPHFDQILSADGKTVQMGALHRNQLIKVYYDQKFLGARHAIASKSWANSSRRDGVGGSGDNKL